MLKVLVIGLGGFAGAVARYGLSGLVQRGSDGDFPAGTLAVNVLGCLVIGALMCLVEERQLLAPGTRLFLLIGLLGSFTTFSTVGYETFEFLRASQFLAGILNAGANLILGVLAVGLGWIAAKALGL